MMMSTTSHKPARPPLNGVDTPTLLATINAVGDEPALAKFQFRAANRWVSGTHSRTTIDSFYGAGEERRHLEPQVYDVDHPTVLVAEDHGPTPVEFLLHALAGCLTAGLGNIAATRGIKLDEVSSTVEGDIDLQGIFGQSSEVRNGYEAIRVRFSVRGDASAEELKALVGQSCARSAVFDVLTNGVPVSIEVNAS
jgi:uncharacterized OsmC-like protein